MVFLLRVQPPRNTSHGWETKNKPLHGVSGVLKCPGRGEMRGCPLGSPPPPRDPLHPGTGAGPGHQGVCGCRAPSMWKPPRGRGIGRDQRGSSRLRLRCLVPFSFLAESKSKGSGQGLPAPVPSLRSPGRGSEGRGGQPHPQVEEGSCRMGSGGHVRPPSYHCSSLQGRAGPRRLAPCRLCPRWLAPASPEPVCNKSVLATIHPDCPITLDILSLS